MELHIHKQHHTIVVLIKRDCRQVSFCTGITMVILIVYWSILNIVKIYYKKNDTVVYTHGVQRTPSGTYMCLYEYITRATCSYRNRKVLDALP